MHWCAWAAAGVTAYVMPLSAENHLQDGAKAYCFYTVGPDIANAVDLFVMRMDDWDKELGPGEGRGEGALLSHWEGQGMEHHCGKAMGLLLGLLVGSEKWGWDDAEDDSDDATSSEG